MRANLLFVLGLVSISCVVSTSFSASIANSADLKAQVETMKNNQNMGSVIMSMAELTTEGQFTALFNAIANLSAFLVKDRAQENTSFAEATAQWKSDVARLTKARDTAKRLYEADNANLQNKLYPERARLIKLIASLEKQLAGLQEDLKELRAQRVTEIALYKSRSSDYTQGVASCKKALPILQTLVNGQSFAEIDADLFAEVSNDLKQSLGKLEMGSLYTVFVESMVSTLKGQNFVNQDALKKVIGLIQSLQSRLERGSVNLDQNEAANLKKFEAAQAALEKQIKETQEQIVSNKARLVTVKATIARVEKHRDEQVAAYKKAVKDLAIVNANYVQRTKDHKTFITEVDEEEQTISIAVGILAKVGITANA